MTVLKAKIGGSYQAILSGYASNVYAGPNPPTDPNIEFWIDTDATLPVVPWIPLPFAATWTNFASPFGPCGYRKIGDIVTLRGMASSTGTANTIATLPVGFRPAINYVCGSVQNDAWCEMRANPDGTITINAGPPIAVSSWVSINPISYSVTA